MLSLIYVGFRCSYMLARSGKVMPSWARVDGVMFGDTEKLVVSRLSLKCPNFFFCILEAGYVLWEYQLLQIFLTRKTRRDGKW